MMQNTTILPGVFVPMDSRRGQTSHRRRLGGFLLRDCLVLTSCLQLHHGLLHLLETGPAGLQEAGGDDTLEVGRQPASQTANTGGQLRFSAWRYYTQLELCYCIARRRGRRDKSYKTKTNCAVWYVADYGYRYITILMSFKFGNGFIWFHPDKKPALTANTGCDNPIIQIFQ